jgi:uncharacterized protein (TIGR02001 family)
MRYFHLATLILLLGAPLKPAFAQTVTEKETVAAKEKETVVSATAGIVSDYRFRGISLSDEHAAVQAALSVNHISGFYAGIWSSSLDGYGELGGSNVELDLYAGYKTALAGGTVDIGLLYYAYPGSSGGDFEFFEPYANFSKSIGPFTGKVAVAFAPAQDALGGNSNIYASGDLSAAIPDFPVTIKGHIGYSKGDTPLTPSGGYADWLVGVDYAWRNFTLGIAYVDTDLGAAQALSGGASKDIVDAAILFSITASL